MNWNEKIKSKYGNDYLFLCFFSCFIFYVVLIIYKNFNKILELLKVVLVDEIEV